MSDERIIRVRTSANQVFEMEEAVAFQSQFIKDAVDFAGIDAIILLHEVEGSVLAKFYQYCKFHEGARKTQHSSGDDVEKWEKDFVHLDQDTFPLLSRAAHYLGIRNLVDLICKTKPLHEKIADCGSKMLSPAVNFMSMAEITPSHEEIANWGCQMLFSPTPLHPSTSLYQDNADEGCEIMLFPPTPFVEVIEDRADNFVPVYSSSEMEDFGEMWKPFDEVIEDRVDIFYNVYSSSEPEDVHQMFFPPTPFDKVIENRLEIADGICEILLPPAPFNEVVEDREDIFISVYSGSELEDVRETLFPPTTFDEVIEDRVDIFVPPYSV